MREIKFKFLVKDNNGKIHLSKAYALDNNGLPDNEEILEDMEVKCTCYLHESNPHCDGSCCEFDEGEVIDKIQYTGLKDSKGEEIYEGDIVKYCYDCNEEEYENSYLITVVEDFGLIQGDFEDWNSWTLKFAIDNDYIFERIGTIYKNPELLDKVS